MILFYTNYWIQHKKLYKSWNLKAQTKNILWSKLVGPVYTEIGDAILYFIQGQGDVCEMIMMILKVAGLWAA